MAKGDPVGNRIRWAIGLAALALLLLSAGTASAATCDDTWTDNTGDHSWFSSTNWSTAAVPTLTDNVCIPAGTGYVLITGFEEATYGAAEAGSLTLGSNGGGTATLDIEGTAAQTTSTPTAAPASLTLGPGGADILNGGTINLTTSCADPSACGSASLNTTGTVQNDGTIETLSGSDGGAEGRSFSGTLVNDGLIETDGHGASLSIANGSILEEASGTTSPDVNPTTSSFTDPAVILDGRSTLAYTGTGASSIEAQGSVVLAGDLGAQQNLVVDGGDGVPCTNAQASAFSSFTNAGTIMLTGRCDAGLSISSGTLTNSGTIVTAPSPTNATRFLQGSLSNSGTLDIVGPTAFDGSGATLTQTSGTTTIVPGQILDLSGSTGNFDLEGGVLTGGGQDQSNEAIISASSPTTLDVENTGGNVIPGSATTPGLMTFDGDYTQGSGGKLTEVVDGASVGTGYSQLAATGNMTLGGTLAIRTVAKPSPGDVDTFLSTSGTISGKFSKLIGQFGPEGTFPPGWTFGYKPHYQSKDAYLEVDPAAGLEVKRTGVGSGSVTSSPAGIRCGNTCVHPFFQTQTVTLTAHPARGSAFGGWSGACKGTARRCKVAMGQARKVTARFLHATTTKLSSSKNPVTKGKKVTYTATVSPRPGGGTVRFTSNGSTISGCGAVAVSTTGKATCSAVYKSAGTRRIVAAYSGDASFAQSLSSPLKEKVSS